MTAIPLIVPNEPPQWVLLDLQGDISLRRTALGGSGSLPADRAQANAIHTYTNLELGVFKQHNGKLQLRIGNHMLNCQLVTLKKPFLVLQRARHMHKQQQQRTRDESSSMHTDDSSDDEQHGGVEGEGEERVGLYCVAVVRQKVLVNTRPAPIIVGVTGPMPVLT